MNEQKLKTVKQWLEALQESARTAVEALSRDKPLDEDPPSLEERSKNLGAAIHKIRELVRPAPKSVAFLEEEAWYRMKRETKPGEKPDPAAGTGAFFTKPEMLDAVLGNPPLDIPPAAEPIDPNAPKLVRGWPEAYDIPELGISWRRFYTPRYVHIIAAWNNGQDAHVYQMTVRPWPLASGERWHVNVTNDGGTVFTMESKSKCLAERCGLSAMRAYIIRGHRKTWRRVHAAEADATGSVPPISPEEAAAAAEPQREVS